MSRPVSPLLHDYKPTAAKKPKKSRAAQWFVVGLGLPLLGLFLVSTLDKPSEGVPAQSGSFAYGLSGEPVSIEEIAVSTAARKPLPEPIPKYSTLELKISRGDTMEKLFRAHSLDLGHLAQISRLDEVRKTFRALKPGDVFEVTHDEGQLVSMYSALDLTTGLSIERLDDSFAAEFVDRPIEKRKRIAQGVIDSSLFLAGADAGLSDKVIMNVAGIFAWDIDFVLDIRQGDSFVLQYEEIWQDGEFVTDGEIVAAEFNNNGRTIRAIRFIDDDGRSDYFTPEGDSVRRAFLRSPVDFRVSSSFNPNRLHPVLKTRRPHRGVDYAAPRGTPIKASGDGKVIFRGVKGGYGNCVILQHGGNITTLYAHMSKFASKVRVGTRVRQGQTIGYVGASGLVSGVHLHYEYRVNGVHRNPRTVELPQSDPIPAQYREAFLAQAGPILEELEQFKRTKLASVGYSNK